MKSLFFIIFVLVTLSGCATYPVYGKVKNGNETFLGTATSIIGGSGDIDMNTSEGAKCTGTYTYNQPALSVVAHGDGKFKCADGRTGTFSFTGDANSGQGFGKLSDGKTITFYFGNSVIANER